MRQKYTYLRLSTTIRLSSLNLSPSCRRLSHLFVVLLA